MAVLLGFDLPIHFGSIPILKADLGRRVADSLLLLLLLLLLKVNLTTKRKA